MDVKKIEGLDDLQSSIVEYLEYLESPERHEDVDRDYENQIFESAMEAFCGADIWDFINSIKMKNG
jgi:hypothetical protein